MSKPTHIAYLVIRKHAESEAVAPIAIHSFLEDAEDMVNAYNQEIEDHNLSGTVNFSVIAVAKYD